MITVVLVLLSVFAVAQIVFNLGLLASLGTLARRIRELEDGRGKFL